MLGVVAMWVICTSGCLHVILNALDVEQRLETQLPTAGVQDVRIEGCIIATIDRTSATREVISKGLLKRPCDTPCTGPGQGWAVEWLVMGDHQEELAS